MAGLSELNPSQDLKNPHSCAGRCVTIALAGNANVGKSAIFNQLTGLTQETGNWSGKTVGVHAGTLSHHGRQFKIVDLPGVYSFTSYSAEEMLAREYILTQHPDVVINVVDATSLERNLYFTLQFVEMNVPLVIALNYADIAKKKHIHIDTRLLSQLLGAPVINTVAIKGLGVHEIVDAALAEAESCTRPANDLRYGPEIESRISRMMESLRGVEDRYPLRWAAIRLLEGDSQILAGLDGHFTELKESADAMGRELNAIHGEDPAAIISAERYALAARIARQVNTAGETVARPASWLENISLHPVTGYVLFIAVMVAILIFISFFGGWLTGLITSLFNHLDPHASGWWGNILWNGGVVGFYAALSVALGFILPFYLILGWLSESGYLPRIAFLMDRPCHTIGLHGQASLPLIMAFGCNVPACLGCRILDNRRDRLIATFLSTLVPCSARTSVVLGLVGAFVGWQWAVGLLFFQLLLMFVIGLILNRLNPSTSPGIIMEIPEYRMPSLKIVWRQAWFRFKDFLSLGVPLIIAGSLVIESLQTFHFLSYITNALNPLTVTWLGLPTFAGVVLIFGILRKEANLALLIALAGGAPVASIITPVQMVVFAIVIMLYIPCISTIAVLLKETDVKITATIVAGEIALALLFGGLAARVLPLIMQ